MPNTDIATSSFRVVRRVPVVTYRDEVLLETDDWLEAEAEVRRIRNHPHMMENEVPQIRGVHPSHDFATSGNPTCKKCGARNNGSYGSHAPCGFDFAGRSLAVILAEYRLGTPEGDR